MPSFAKAADHRLSRDRGRVSCGENSAMTALPGAHRMDARRQAGILFPRWYSGQCPEDYRGELASDFSIFWPRPAIYCGGHLRQTFGWEIITQT